MMIYLFDMRAKRLDSNMMARLSSVNDPKSLKEILEASPINAGWIMSTPQRRAIKKRLNELS